MKSKKLLLLSLAPLALASTAFGAFSDKTWDGSSNGGWGGANWDDNNATITGANNLIFTGGANLADNWTGNFRTVGALTYGGTTDIKTRLSTTATPATLGRGITFDTTEPNAEINVLTGSTANVLLTNDGLTGGEATNAAITLADNLVIDHRGDGTLTIDTLIDGTGNVTINGDDRDNKVIFDNAGTANTYTGDLAIDGASLQILNAGKLGNAANNIDISNGGELYITGASTIAASRATTLSGGDAYLRTDAAVTVNAVIDGAGKLIKTGTGNLTMTATNTFSGGFEIQNARVTINTGSGGAGALGSGVITLNSDVVTSATAGSEIFIQDPGAVNPTISNDIVLTGNGGSIAVGVNTTTLSGAITGDGDFRKRGGGALVLSGAYAFAGDFTIENGGAVTLEDGGQFTFDIGVSGDNNSISHETGSAALSIDSLFVFDLTDATTGLADQWSIIGSTLIGATTFGSNFDITGFTETAGVWSNGAYEFSEATGNLTVVPEPGTFALIGGLLALASVATRRRK
ncbi:MAG: autotransporter-associated beta strand repeat-containing protein [Lentimonas sp.]